MSSFSFADAIRDPRHLQAIDCSRWQMLKGKTPDGTMMRAGMLHPYTGMPFPLSVMEWANERVRFLPLEQAEHFADIVTRLHANDPDGGASLCGDPMPNDPAVMTNALACTWGCVAYLGLHSPSTEVARKCRRMFEAGAALSRSASVRRVAMERADTREEDTCTFL